ncbi:GHKL domain-containing protein [Bacillus lacus]|uniref:histidine kinase n=1 Tax=Metabacillus lacus TaxID=1983721 RepID=A0A7X2LXE2_9BACI|nr:HAMP domain-containing sensor histidine kinase [Metabacillus lacus]MRX71196.1 GHKL domain-containing protein [Metabacillus lacus]
MDTKLKNRLLLGSWIFLLVLGTTGIVTAIKDFGRYAEVDYFASEDFHMHLSEYKEYLSLYELDTVTEEQAKKNIVVTDEEIMEYRYRHGDLQQQVNSIHDQYESRILDALQAENKEIESFLKEERDKKIQDITENFKSDEYVKEKIVQEKEVQLSQSFQQLNEQKQRYSHLKNAFIYYLVNTETGEAFTNLKNADNRASANQIFNSKEILYSETYTGDRREGSYYTSEAAFYINNGEWAAAEIPYSRNGSYEGNIGVHMSSAENTVLEDGMKNYQQERMLYLIFSAIGLLSAAAAYFLFKKSGLKNLYSLKKWDRTYSRLPIDAAVILLLFSVFMAFIQIADGTPYRPDWYWSTIVREGLLTAFFLSAGAAQVVLLRRRMTDIDGTKEWRNSFLKRGSETIREAFANLSLGIKAGMLLIIMFLSGLGLAGVFLQPVLILVYAPLFVIVTLPALFLMLKNLGRFNRISAAATQLAAGSYSGDVTVKGKSALAELAQNLNTLKQELKLSHKEQAKSERLKTELITNVSHDLRTPLTSIITYTELLKSQGLDAEEHGVYVEIIDRKSKRLKVLIDDLFEASKMASGSIALTKEKVDLSQLLQQALGEYNEAIESSTLQFRVIDPDPPVYAEVDGQKMWRVFDNLISNILKYSLEHTRVYISLKNEGDQALVIFKNVSKYELSENTDEFFERFKRGDTSRNTEGSGLGLAIAKSIVDLHQGSMDIEIDGDLFKVTVALK